MISDTVTALALLLSNTRFVLPDIIILTESIEHFETLITITPSWTAFMKALRAQCELLMTIVHGWLLERHPLSVGWVQHMCCTLPSFCCLGGLQFLHQYKDNQYVQF
jgi:hypothetical protein